MIEDSRQRCLCGSAQDYSRCCGLFHSGEKHPATAEALMRSRFTAYAMRNAAYLSETWVAEKCPQKIDFSREKAEWRRLEILGVKKGGAGDAKGIVEFKAFFCLDGDEYAMHEISRFVKKDGRWYYLDGAVKSIGKAGQTTAAGKNAPCACGSGKKYKRCCGAA